MNRNPRSRTTPSEKLHITLCWVKDRIGEVFVERIEAAYTYKKNYLGFDSISQKELDWICDVIDAALERDDSKFRIYNSMGEICLGKLPRNDHE